MRLGRFLVEAVVVSGASPTQLARSHGISRSWLDRLLARYREGGYEAVEPRSRRPRSSPARTPPGVVELILQLRAELVEAGLDAGAQGILSYLRMRSGAAQTLKRCLRCQAAPHNLAHLQLQLDSFRNRYNQDRPHEAASGKTPWQAFEARLKGPPSLARFRSSGPSPPRQARRQRQGHRPLSGPAPSSLRELSAPQAASHPAHRRGSFNRRRRRRLSPPPTHPRRPPRLPTD